MPPPAAPEAPVPGAMPPAPAPVPEVPAEAQAPPYAPPPPPPPGAPGAYTGQQPQYGQPYAPQPAPAPPCPKSKVLAGVLGIIFGGLGVHKFYLGYTTEGLIMLAVTVLGWIITGGLASGLMSLIGLIEGIIYLTKPDQEFCDMYVYNKKGWF
jgi:TM2 domain-containing membrane protein YozV